MFEDGGEPISSEIVSKVLLLANDTAITDGCISELAVYAL